MKNKTKWIFLDFDGVLHDFNDILNNNLFCYNVNLKFLVMMLKKENFNVNVVFSTSWRLNSSLTDLKDNIYEIVDDVSFFDKTCPEIHSYTHGDYDKPGSSQNNRYEEINKYLITHDIKYGDYVVLDDAAGLFFKTYLESDENGKSKLDSNGYPIINTVNLVLDKNNKFLNENSIDENQENIYNLLNDNEINFGKSIVLTSNKLRGGNYLSELNVHLAFDILTKNSKPSLIIKLS